MLARRKAAWEKVIGGNGGIRPNCGAADTRLLHRARSAAVPTTRGGGSHPNREIWVRDPRKAERLGFKLGNKAPAAGEQGVPEHVRSACQRVVCR